LEELGIDLTDSGLNGVEKEELVIYCFVKVMFFQRVNLTLGNIPKRCSITSL